MSYDMYLDSEFEEKPKPKPCLGFRFTNKDELAIKGACRLAKKFMQGYGKGEERVKIDLSHYYQ